MSASGRNKKVVVNPAGAKGNRYRKVLEDIQRTGVCPFCPENFKWHTHPILKRNGHWLITRNFNPYKNAEHHFLIVNDEHMEEFRELGERDWREITALIRWAIAKFKIKGGGIAMRFGDPTHTGATVSHLHAHLIVPTVKRGRTLPVWFPFG